MPPQRRQAQQQQERDPRAPLMFEQFAGVNTQTTRAGVDDKQAYWLDGFMPVAPRNLRVLPDVGTAIYTAGAGRTVILFDFFVIAEIPYMCVLLDDGSLIQVNLNNSAVTTILAANTIINPSLFAVGFAQWAEKYLIIVSNQINGFWVWDGTLLYMAGSLTPTATITDGGSGYSSSPVVTASGGLGSGATFQAQIANGQVINVSVTNPGSGYQATDMPSLVFAGGQTSGSGGSLTAIMSSVAGGTGASINVHLVFTSGAGLNYSISSVNVVANGSGYSGNTQINAYATLCATYISPNLQPILASGSLVSVSVISPGYFHQIVGGSPVGVGTVTDGGGFSVSSVSINAAGSAYSPSASVSVAGGAPIIPAVIGLQLSNGSIVNAPINNAGSYSTSVAPTLTVFDTLVVAQGTIGVMPFGVSGNSVETYLNRVWVLNDNEIFFTSPLGPFDFDSGNGAGSNTSNSSKLRVKYTKLLSNNGVLYTFADSSVDYISNVNTAGTPPVTTFKWLNADPEAGTPYPFAAMPFDRGTFFANAFGVHIIYGSEVRKYSGPLDGVYNSVANFNSQQLSSGEAIIFGKKIAVVLVPIVDPVSGSTVNKLLMFDGERWFAAEQNITLSYIRSQEINSIFTCYGTDGSTVKPLFNTPSSALTRTAQTRLWDAPGGYQFHKGASRFWSLWNYNSSVSTSITLSVDALDNQNNFTHSHYTIVGPSGTGYYATLPQAVGEQGTLLGMTIQTRCPDAQLVSAMLQPEFAEYRG